MCLVSRHDGQGNFKCPQDKQRSEEGRKEDRKQGEEVEGTD